MKTPVFFYPSRQAMASITPPDRASVEQDPDQAHACRRANPIDTASQVADRLSTMRELSRLRAKAVREKQALLKAVLDGDLQKFQREIRGDREPEIISRTAAQRTLRKRVHAKADSMIVGCSEPVEDARRRGCAVSCDPSALTHGFEIF